MTQTRDAQPLVDALSEQVRLLQRPDPLVIGVLTGGVWIAEQVNRALGIETPIGQLSINFYRDDFTRVGLHPRVSPSNLPFDVDNRNIILVDDVLHTGRTIRAALNEIFDYGRPASVALAVLIDRQGRELPIQPDVTAETVTLGENEQIKLVGPDPLQLVQQQVKVS